MTETERELDLKLGEALAEIRRLNEILARKAEQSAQQEPVDAVLLDDMVEGTHPSYGRGLFTTDNCVKLLYTAPPRHQLLTDEQIDNLANNIYTADPVKWWRQLARAIDAAHKITGAPQ